MGAAPKALILLSGGLDSAANLALAARDGRAALAVTIAYGQKAEKAELRSAERLARAFQVEWLALELRWLGNLGGSALTAATQLIPDLPTADLDNLASAQKTAAQVWVPNRNGLLLNAAASVAEARGIPEILVGFNREEATTFPDNSLAYLEALNQSFVFSTMGRVRVDSYTVNWDKTEIYAAAAQAGLDFSLVWSCYQAGENPCGVCESCRRFFRAQAAHRR